MEETQTIETPVLVPSWSAGTEKWRVCWNCQKAFALNEGDLDFQRRNIPFIDIDALIADPKGQWTCASCTVEKFRIGWAISDALMKPGLLGWYFKKFLLRTFFGVDTRMAGMHAGSTSAAVKKN